MQEKRSVIVYNYYVKHKFQEKTIVPTGNWNNSGEEALKIVQQIYLANSFAVYDTSHVATYC